MSQYAEDPSVSNSHYEVQVVIERPVTQVWNQFLDLRSWITSHDIELVSGTWGTVGSITRVSPKNSKDLNLPPAPYHYCKITELVPERQYVLKTYPEKGGSYGMQFTAFDYTRFVTTPDGTLVTFNIFSEFRSETLTQAAVDADMDGSREGMLANLKNLKHLVER
jgi:hypothetical protein